MPINQIIKTFFNSFIISSLIISLCYPLSVYPCDFTAKDEPKGFTDLSSKEKVNVSQEWKPFEREEFGDEEDFEDEDFEDDEYGEDEKVALKKLKKHIKPIKILRGSTQQDPVSKSGDKKTGQTKVSDPVVIPTGNYFESVTDLPANRTDTALLFKRYYNSLNSVEKGSFGYGWSHRYDIRLEEKEKGAIVHMGTGESHYYKKDGKKYVAPKGVYNDLVRGRKGNVYLITPDRVTYVFDSSYHRNVTYIKDLNGVLFTMKYNNITQKLVKVTDRYGDWIKFSYDFNGKIKEIKDSAGRKVKYVCNYTDDILLEVQGVTGGIVQYKYDRNKNMVEKTYSDGVKLIMRYDEKNRVIEQGNEQDRLMYRFVYDDQKKIVTFYERAVKRTQSYYNDDNKIVKEIDALGGVIDRKYDKEGNVACVLDKNGGEYSYRYNARGDLIMMVDPLGNVTRYRYDRRSNKLIVVENALGVTTEMLRDKQGNIRKIIEGDGAVTVFKNDRYGMPVMITDPVGKKTQINYDSRGYIKSVKKMGDDVGQGIVRYYKRDGLGNVILYTDPNGNKTKYWYDARLNLRKIIRKTNNGKDAVIKMEYDQFDNVVSMKDARRNITRYTYTKDWWNKLAAVINTDGVKTRYIYDMYGKLLKYVNGKGAVTKYTYDDLGEMIKMTDPLGFSQTYAYDQGGNLIEVVNGKGVALWYSYDPLGRMIKATDGNGNAVEMKYDALSNLLMVKDPKGGEVFYRYDVLNRLIKQRDQLDNEKVYSYDKAGSL
ncbi:MAG: DUF6531 domain-containing protein, partial [Candidatus Ancaeobacter aquaticus]|nr:DUF6531 domain-containing protein [Candidatus Ancaeobacter aquaticus]